MGEEQKKLEELKKAEEAAAAPQEIVLKVFMHCEGCAKKVRKSLRGFEGVEDVLTDCKTHNVTVKGEKADPLKVVERVKRKTHRHVELISPIPQPPPPPEEPKKPEEKKEQPEVISLSLCVHMHCEACAQEIRKQIQRMEGVESVETDLKSFQVTVKGIFDPTTLVELIHRRIGKRVAIIKVEAVKKEEEKKEAATPPPPLPPLMELKNDFHYYHPQNFQQYYPPRHVPDYPPQIFSDENPNACSIM